MRSRLALVVTIALLVGLLPLGRGATAQTAPSDPTVPAGRETEPIVLTGSNFPSWATLGDVALKANSVAGAQCFVEKNGFPPGMVPDTPVTQNQPCTHNQYDKPDFQSSDYVPPVNATPVDRILGYRWNGSNFEQIPFQIDEMFIHYLSNNNSEFSHYSGTDQHTTYAFDREGFRWTQQNAANPCLAEPASEVATDPVPGLDTDDEMVFMAQDAGARAPDAALPQGVLDSYEVAITDPSNPDVPAFVYLMKTDVNGPVAEFGPTNGYVRYERDADSNTFLKSQSSYGSYGATFKGAWYDPATGICHSDPSEAYQHRPSDAAWIKTPRYEYRYDGRWLMTQLRINQADESGALNSGIHESTWDTRSDTDTNYTYDLVDQWKARAFQQRPGGDTPCCGYEEEVNNWGGSSILMGERVGPVRVIRETWGADSGTNVVRREIFYRDEVRMISFLRVHVIPPGDGIYAQWDYNAGRMNTYYNPENPDGVVIDGCNDDVGNSSVYASQDGVGYDPDGADPHQCAGDTNQAEVGVHDPSKAGHAKQCPGDPCFNNDMDLPDPTFGGPNAGLNWEEIAGENGTLVMRTSIKQVTPGSAHSIVAVPYYRDDSCFDDGTGSNPGPHLHGRGVDNGAQGQYTAPDGTSHPRECWNFQATAEHPRPTNADAPANDSDPRYWQGSIGTNGVHILMIADSDNAHQTVPLTEVDSENRIVVLKPMLDDSGKPVNVGERYGRGTEKPLVVVAHPENRDTYKEPQEPTESPSAEPSNSSHPTTNPSQTGSSPTPTNTAAGAPEKQTTTITFTAGSQTSGQYSDRAEVGARLTDSVSGDPIAHEDVAFDLIGGDGTSTFAATTDSDGVATVGIDLVRGPGSYQLVARYDGTDTREPSADQTGFVIDRDDSILKLKVTHPGSGTKLKARLLDADSGAPLANRDITFVVGGKKVGTKTTSASGRVALKTRRSGGSQAAFRGDDFYIGDSAARR